MIPLLWRSARQARYVMVGALALFLGFQLIIVGQAAEIERTQSFSRIADLVPAFLQRGLGSKAMLFATFKGTVAFGYFHPVVCMLIAGVAMYLTTEVAHEVESGLVDLELARAVPRHRLVSRSLLLAVCWTAVALMSMFVGTSAGARLFDAGGLGLPAAAVRVRLLAHLGAIACCFGGFGLWLGSISKRWAFAFTTGVLTAIVLYLVDYLAIGWRVMRSVAWVSPFHYYQPLSIIAGDAPHWRNLAVLLSAAAVFVAAAYRQFQTRDL